jgi:tight adherence protein C
MNPTSVTVEADEHAAQEAVSLDRQQAQSWQRLAEPLARLATPQDEDEPTHRLRFMQAGLRGRSAPLLFYITKVALVLGLPVLVGAAWMASGRSVSTLGGITLMLVAAGVGALAPQAWLQGRTRRRQRELFEAFPDAIDLLVVCMEAGLSLDAALERVWRDIRLRSPALADELELLGSELGLGTARAVALRHLAQRTGVEEVRLLVATLIQADRFGLGLVQALRVHAQELRLRRQLRAEEEAAKMPLKLLFPLIFTLFPALMVVLLGPAAIGLMRQMGPLLGSR